MPKRIYKDIKNYEDLKIRVVPPGVVRYGAFCEPGVVVMPGFVNIGAFYNFN